MPTPVLSLFGYYPQYPLALFSLPICSFTLLPAAAAAADDDEDEDDDVCCCIF